MHRWPGQRLLRLPAALALDLAAAALLGSALFIWWTGGGRVEFLGITISARTWVRPAVLAAAILAAGQAFRPTRARGALVAIRLSHVTMAAVAIAALGVTFAAIVRACGGLDSHGYVAFSGLLADLTLQRALPDLSWLPVDAPALLAAPLGFIPSLDGRAIVPEFPPGAPLLMALARTVAGAEAVFLVGWLAGIALAAAAFAVTRRRYDALAAMFAATAVIAHPVGAAYSLQAMSDVPAALWTAIAVWAMTAADRPGPILAGVAGSLAVLTRPPLLLPLLVIAAVVARQSRRDAAVFAAALAPGVLALMLVQYVLYGSPFVSGHGGAGHLFTAAVLPHNLLAHAKWLLILHTPLAIGLVWIGIRADGTFGRTMLLAFVAVAVPYLFYGVRFDDWEMVRFLLPGIVLLAPVAANGLRVALRRVPSAAAQHVLAAAACVAMLAASAHWLEQHGVFQLAQKESKYPRVGRWFVEQTPPDAVVLAALHSGSIDYYSDRLTLRWDAMSPQGLRPLVDAARARGRRVYLVVDENYEVDAFRRRLLDGRDGSVRLEPLDRIFTVQLFELTPAS